MTKTSSLSMTTTSAKLSLTECKIQAPLPTLKLHTHICPTAMSSTRSYEIVFVIFGDLLPKTVRLVSLGNFITTDQEFLDRSLSQFLTLFRALCTKQQQLEAFF